MMTQILYQISYLDLILFDTILEKGRRQSNLTMTKMCFLELDLWAQQRTGPEWEARLDKGTFKLKAVSSFSSSFFRPFLKIFFGTNFRHLFWTNFRPFLGHFFGVPGAHTKSSGPFHPFHHPFKKLLKSLFVNIGRTANKQTQKTQNESYEKKVKIYMAVPFLEQFWDNF